MKVSPADFFVLRTPLLPFDTLQQLSDRLTAPGVPQDDQAALAFAVADDRACVGRRLRALVEAPVVREAIGVASPDLRDALDRWDVDSPERVAATERAVMKYVTRMASRATPFGLFASCGVGAIAAHTELVVAPRHDVRRHTRLDMDYLVLLAETLARDPAPAAAITYSPNSSLYRLGDRWRYVETRWQGKQRSQHLVAVDDQPALAATLERARRGASRTSLADALVDDEIAPDEAAAFITDLIDSQVLVPDVQCPLTGADPLTHLIAMALRTSAGAEVAARLDNVRAALSSLDTDGLGLPPSRYSEIATTLAAVAVPVDAGKLFQVDMARPAPNATLDQALVDEIVRGADVLRRISRSGDDNELAAFRSAFAERYDGRDVPLVEAADEESGIGASLVEGGQREASPLLRGLSFPSPDEVRTSWGPREAFLLRRVGELLQAGSTELVLSAADIDRLAVSDPPELPEAAALLATLVAGVRRASAGRDERDDRVVLEAVSGPSGANLLGRFCHADPELAARVAAHLRAEEALDPEAVFAEVVHLPEDRLGNVLLRPVLRRAEIPYLGHSGAPVECQLPVTDLTLRLVDGRFELWSQRLGRRIVPRLTSAHNFRTPTLTIYRLLCLLQGQGRQGCAWDWGPLADLPFLPRVSFGRVVFARATWHVSKEEIGRLLQATGDAARYEAVQRCRAERRLPRWVVVADHDNTLPVDLDNALSVDVLLHLLRTRDAATLTELYPQFESLCASGDDGHYLHELVIPCVGLGTRNSPVRRDQTSLATAPPAPARTPRIFAPGSEWTYAKLYTGSGTADRVLSRIVGPVSRSLYRRGLIDRWFFIRYADTAEHLRWRLHAVDRRDADTVRREVERNVAAAMSDHLVRRLTFDTYERELERYGGDVGIELSEQLFWADSEAVIDWLDPDSGLGDDPEWRWQAAMAGADAWLADLGLDTDARWQLAKDRRAAFGREFRADAQVGRQLAAKYRAARPQLQRLFTSEAEKPLPWLDVLARRSTRAREVVAALHAAWASGELSVPVRALAESYVHMHLNRLFRAEHRAHELVVYDFLSCLYQSRAMSLRRGDTSAAAGADDRRVQGPCCEAIARRA